YRESLALASSVGARTVAFPAISTGAYGFPMERAAAIAVRDIASYLDSHHEIDRVMLTVRGETASRIHRDALERVI
ncbi:MAG: macro domain-containing protein, partial [Chloroflexia bacterium]|nr:macro domain-containing protein [Chloroflexia bacterium]